MQKLSKYDTNSVPKIFGLKNNSSLCYLNSLIQSLMSCSSFNEYLVNNENKYKNNQIVKEYLKLYNYNKNESNQTNTAFNILKALNDDRIKIGSKFQLSLYSQEDIHEGLILLLDSIGEGIDTLFHNRYRSEIICLKCNHRSKPGDNGNYEEPPEIIIDLSEQNPHINKNLDTKEKIEQYIKTNMQIPREYKCANCKIVNTYDEKTKTIAANVAQFYSLKRLSEIIVLMFKKYKNKKELYFPEKLNFDSVNGNLEYRLVSQVEHSGSMNSGHYTALCLREKTDEFYSNRKIKGEYMIENNMKNLINKSHDEQKEIEKKIENIKKLIKNDEVDKTNADQLGVFGFNDSNIRYSKFNPTINTYVLFYHLF